MLNQRLSAAQAVAAELFPAEIDLDNAIVHVSRLAIAVVEGRRAAKLPITAGQLGLSYVAQAGMSLVQARDAIGAAHAAFHDTQIEIGLRTVGVGDLWECPENTTPTGHFRDAANAA